MARMEMVEPIFIDFAKEYTFKEITDLLDELNKEKCFNCGERNTLTYGGCTIKCKRCNQFRMHMDTDGYTYKIFEAELTYDLVLIHETSLGSTEQGLYMTYFDNKGPYVHKLLQESPKLNLSVVTKERLYKLLMLMN